MIESGFPTPTAGPDVPADAREVRAREERLRAQVRELTIEIDEVRQAQCVAEITDTDYFRGLRGRAAELRRIVDGPTPSDR